MPTETPTFAPMSYRELSDRYEGFKQRAPAQFSNLSMADWAKEVNNATESNVASEALNPSYIKDMSIGIDRFIDKTGAADLGGSFGTAMGTAFGMEDVGERAGRGLARGLVNFAPIVAAEAFSAGGATIPLLGMAGAGLLQGSQTYTDTGSGLAGLISGGAAALMPGAFRLGGQAGLKLAGAPLWDEAAQAGATVAGTMTAQGSQKLAGSILPKVGQYFGETTGQRAAEFAGGNIAGLIAGEAAGQATSLAAGQGLYNPLAPEHLLELGITQLPLAGLGIPGLRKDTAASFVKRFMDTTEAANKADRVVRGNRIADGVQFANESALQNTVGMNDRQTHSNADLLVDFGIKSSKGNELGRSTGGEVVVGGLPESKMFNFEGQLVEHIDNEKGATGKDFYKVVPKDGGKAFLVDPVRLTSSEGLFNLGEGTNPEFQGTPRPARKPVAGITETVAGIEPAEWQKKVDGLMTEIAPEGVTQPTQSQSPQSQSQLPDRPAQLLLTDSKVESVPPAPQPAPDIVLANIRKKYGLPIPEKAPTAELRQALTDVITLRATMKDKFGFELPNITDAQLEGRMREFTRANAQHPDPMQGFVESYKAETLRKIEEENALRHAGQKIGVEEQSMNEGIELLGKAHPDDAATVARIVKETDNGQNTLGTPEAVYRAYGSFVKKRTGPDGVVRPYSQGELAGSLAASASKADMKARAGVEGTTLSMDAATENAPGGEEAMFSQMDPGVKQRMTEQEELNNKIESLRKEDGPDEVGSTVAAMSDDIKLVTTLGKLSGLVKNRPDLWSKIWQRNGKEGELRTRIYTNLVFDKMQQRAGKVTSSELNQLFAQHDQVYGTELAYYKKGKLTDIPKPIYEKLQKTFEYIASLPEEGVDALGGSGGTGSGTKEQLTGVVSGGLDNLPRASTKAGLVTGQAFYQRLFQEKFGYSEPLSKAMTDTMLRVIAAFKTADRARVTGLDTKGTELGASIGRPLDPLWTGLVGIGEGKLGSDITQEGGFQQFVLAHELTHSAENYYQLQKSTGEQYLPQGVFESMQKLDQLSETLSVEERSLLLHDAAKAVLPKSVLKNEKLFDLLTDYSAQSPDEFRASMGALVAMSRADKGVGGMQSVKDLMMYSPKEAVGFIKGLARYFSDGAKGLWAGLKAGTVGLLGETDAPNKQLDGLLGNYFNHFNKVLRSSEEIDQMVKQLHQFEQMAPTTYASVLAQNKVGNLQLDTFKGGPDWLNKLGGEVKKEVGTDEPSPTKPSFLHRNLESFTQLAERFPVVRDMSNIVFSAQHMMEQNIARLHSVLGLEVRNGVAQFDKKLSTVNAFSKSEVSREAFNKMAAAQQTEKALLSRDHPMMKSAMKGLSPAQQDVTWDVFEKVGLQNVAVGNQRLAGIKEINGLILGRLIQSLEPTRRYKDSESIGNQLITALGNKDPQGFMAALQGLTPEVASKVQALAGSLHGTYEQMKGVTESQPWWFTERRFGDYGIIYKTASGEMGRATAATREQADRIIAAEKAKGSTVLKELTPEDSRKPYVGFAAEYKQAVSDVESKNLAVLKEVLRDQPELLAQIEPLLKVDADVEAEMQARDVRKLNPNRRFAAGREHVDYFDAAMINNSAVVRGMGKRWLRAKSNLALLDPELAQEPALQRLAKQHVDNFLTPDSPVGQALAKANFYYYIVGNLANMMQEPFQQFSTILPALVNEGGSLVSAGKALLNSNRRIAKYWADGKTGSADHDYVLRRFKDEKENPHGFLSEFDSEGLASINAIRHSEGKGIISNVGEALGKPLLHLTDLAKNAYLKVPEHNARVTMLAAFDVARQKGLSVEAAYDEAVRVYRYSNFAGGKAGRAVGVYSGRDNFTKTAAQTVMSLQSYQMGYISMLSRLLKQGFSNKGGDLTPAQVHNARKAAVTMLGVQFALGGALGMPFAGQGVALLQQAFPNLELEKGIRETVAGMAGQDKELGGLIANSITHGVTGEMTGVDVSSRFSLGNMFGMTAQGWDAGNMAGPTGGMVRNLLTGMKDTSTGDYLKAVEDVVPPQLKRVINAYREGNEFRDAKGNLLLDGTTTEKAFRLLGYTPTRERDIREQQRILSRTEDISKRELAGFYRDLADRTITGEFSGVRDALLERQRSDPSFDARAGLRVVAKQAEQRHSPIDLRSEGTARTADDRQRLVRTYATNGGPSEVERLMKRVEIERLVGLAGAGVVSPTELRVAQLTDRLRSLDSSITLDQARLLASKKVMQMTSQQRSQIIGGGSGGAAPF